MAHSSSSTDCGAAPTVGTRGCTAANRCRTAVTCAASPGPAGGNNTATSPATPTATPCTPPTPTPDPAAVLVVPADPPATLVVPVTPPVPAPASVSVAASAVWARVMVLRSAS